LGIAKARRRRKQEYVMPQKLAAGLSGRHFIHPLDRSSMQAVVDRITGSLVRGQIEKLMKEAEDEFFLLNLADNTRLDHSQGGSLYRLVVETADVFSMPTPHVFLDTTPAIQPRTVGGAKACLILPSALVADLAEAQLRVVIAHELGHILCGHSFYRLLAENFEHVAKLAAAVPFLGPVLSLSMQLMLFDWYRKSELSADRAALLGTQDLEAVQQVLLWFAGSNSKIGDELSAEGFRRQADEFRDAIQRRREGGIFDRMGYLLSGLMVQQALSPHPWPAVRLHEITQWAESEEYRRLLAGQYETFAPGEQASTAETTARTPHSSVTTYVTQLGRSAGSALTGLFARTSGAPDTNVDSKNAADAEPSDGG
jgi:Zn-dependent protease with chaperone function